LLNFDEVDKRLEEANGPKDYLKLYVDMFGEEPPVFDWGIFPSEQIIDAILDRKPIKKDKLYEEGEIVF